MRLTLGEIAQAAGGELIAGDPGLAVASVSVDSRRLEPGGLFVALRAERDGHDFASGAVAAGAAAVLVERMPPGLPDGAGVVRVADTGVALSALGAHARRLLGDLPVVGITGSTGKTSTKDLTAAALGSRLAVAASPASWNNEIGVPLTLLATDKTEVVVLEMGSRGVGHIAALCAVAHPTVGVITNIGVAHVEFFGSRAEVARAKGELIEALPAGGTAILCADDDTTPELAARTSARVLTFGYGAEADVVVSGVRLDDELRPSFDLLTPWGVGEFGPLPVRGAHQAMNAAVAVAVAGVLGLTVAEAAEGLAATVGSAWRMELTHTPAGLVVLNDAYNANPASMRAALYALAALPSRRRFAVLGHMAELGEESEELHRLIGRQAAAGLPEALVVVGPEAAGIVQGAAAAGLERIIAVDTAEAALEVLAGRLQAGDAVLVKASRVVGLEALATALCELSFGDTPNPGREPPR